jgi:predicted Zn-dependent protease
MGGTRNPIRWLATIAAAAAVLTGCRTNPATGRNQLLLLSIEESIALGEESKEALTQEYGGRLDARELESYVNSVGVTLVEQTEGDYPQLPWEFTVLDSDVINAFALPGGKIFATRGLLARLDNEAEMAAVIGHEIGHVTAEHVNERISRTMLVQGLAVGSAVAAGSSDSDWAVIVPLVVGVAGQGYLLSFSRSQELEADRLGVRYVTAAGYDPHAMMDLLEVLEESSQGPRPPQFLSTHPYPETRIAQVRTMLAGPYAYTQDNAEYGLRRERYQRQALPYLGPQTARAGPETWCVLCRVPEAGFCRPAWSRAE